ncbi:MAG: enoyl-CoA hydratase-related protein [Actinomycetota bacterium]
MNRPDRRNALSLEHLRELLDAFREVGESDAIGVVLGGRGSVFSAGHDFAELAGAGAEAVRATLETCTDLVRTIQVIPQPVLARVHGLATAAGFQLVATADLAVAGESAGFAAPGGKGGWFCHTPMVAVGRAVSPKRALELAFTGDPIDARTAGEWGIVNRVVPDPDLDGAVLDLLARATRGSVASKGTGKQTFYRQIGLDPADAYRIAVEAMVASSQTPDAREGMRAFLEKRPPEFGRPEDSTQD